MGGGGGGREPNDRTWEITPRNAAGGLEVEGRVLTACGGGVNAGLRLVALPLAGLDYLSSAGCHIRDRAFNCPHKTLIIS